MAVKSRGAPEMTLKHARCNPALASSAVSIRNFSSLAFPVSLDVLGKLIGSPQSAEDLGSADFLYNVLFIQGVLLVRKRVNGDPFEIEELLTKLKLNSEQLCPEVCAMINFAAIIPQKVRYREVVALSDF